MCESVYFVQVEQLGNFKIVHEVEGTGEKTEFRFHVKSKLQGGASVTVSVAAGNMVVIFALGL